MLPRYAVVIVLCITLFPGGETALRSGRYRHIVVCIMTKAREITYILEDVEIRHRNYENRMIPYDVVDCLASSLLIKDVSNFILFSKPIILNEALSKVS